MTFYPELLKFIAQSKTSFLGTSQYQTEYLGLIVKVSFGKGRQANVPWIAFLGGNNTISRGIYPVYLLFKDKNLLILAYGVSETKTPSSNWSISNPMNLTTYFSSMNLENLKRYGGSYFFRAYQTNQELKEKEIENDLAQIVEIYKRI